MRKIPTLFRRDHSCGCLPPALTPEVTPGCEWVLAGEGVATRKYDGTCVMLDADGKWWARREVKQGKVAPANWVPLEADASTGKTVGWEPIEQSSFAKIHAEALRNTFLTSVPGTYELVGPKVNGNPEQVIRHYVWAHAAADVLTDVPREFDLLATYLGVADIEGIVWHHPDGRMAKTKGRDFGHRRGAR